MKLAREDAVHVLQRVGLPELADEVAASLPDTVDIDELHAFLLPHGITRDEVISRLGGTP